MTTDLLREANQEIKRLRKEIELLRSRLSGFEDSLLLLKADHPYRGTGMIDMGLDIAWQIDQALKRVDEQNAIGTKQEEKPPTKFHSPEERVNKAEEAGKGTGRREDGCSPIAPPSRNETDKWEKPGVW